jgi:hypothetical protein
MVRPVASFQVWLSWFDNARLFFGLSQAKVDVEISDLLLISAKYSQINYYSMTFDFVSCHSLESGNPVC